jgi:two-component system LytT family response regulator
LVKLHQTNPYSMNQRINCVIIDDDQYAIDIISDYIEEIPNLYLQKSYTSSLQALTALSTGIRPDLVFMDIDMPGLTGIQLARQLEGKIDHIIFTTSHSEHAIAAFDVGAKHYLLKPFDLGRFVEVVMKVTAKNNVSASTTVSPVLDYYLRPGPRGEFLRLLKKDIYYIQAAGNYIHVFSNNKRHTTYMTMKEMEKDFPTGDGFYRVNRSYIINTAHVTKVNGNSIYVNTHPITMSGEFKTDFLKYLKDHTLTSNRIIVD